VVRLTLRALWGGVVGFYNSNNLTHASSIAYFALLSLFPFLLLIFSLLGHFTASDGDRQAVVSFLFRYFPRQFDFLTTQLDAFRQQRVPLGIVSSILLVWTSLGFFGAITTAVNDAWGVEKQRSYFKSKLVAFVMLACAGMLMALALALVSAESVVRASWFALVIERTPALLVLGGIASRWAATMMLVVVVGLVFFFVPNTRVRFRDVWIGAILTGVLWHGALAGFSWYVRDLSRFSIHGSIAAVVVFLVWIYVSAVILLYGVEFTACFARLLGDLRLPPGPGHTPPDAP
jgi:membrane protein